MAKLSRSELRQLVTSAGFTGKDVDIAVAVILAESGGNPRAHNAVPPDDSYGLFQVNMLGALGPDRRKRYGLKANTDLYDPATNARVAYGIFKGSGWKAWTTYTRGAYKKYMESGNGSDVNTPIADTSTQVPVQDRGFFGVSSALNAFGETFLKGFASFGAVIVAVTLLVLGFVILMRNQVGAVVSGGKIAKVAKVAKAVS